MNINRDGRTVGGLDREVWVDGVVPPGLVGVRAGGWDWKTPTIIAGPLRVSAPSVEPERWEIWQCDLTTNVLSPIDQTDGANEFGAGGDRWAAGRRTLNGHDHIHVAGSYGQIDGAGFYAFGRDGELVYKPSFHADGGIAIRFPDGREPVWPTESFVAYGDGWLLYRRAGKLWAYDLDRAVETEIPESTSGGPVCRLGNRGYRVVWKDDPRNPQNGWTFVHPIDSLVGWVINEGPHDFQPAIVGMGAGLVRIVSAHGSGERPHEFQQYDLDTTTHQISRDGGETWAETWHGPLADLGASVTLEVPARTRLLWRGLSDATRADPGNCTQGWYDDDPRPTIEGVGWLDRTKVRANQAKLIGIVWSPHEAPGERAEVIAYAREFETTVWVYCDAPHYRYLDEVRALRAIGLDAIPWLYAQPTAEDQHDPARIVQRITAELVALEQTGENRIALWRTARTGQWPASTIEAIQAPLTQLCDDHPSIVADIGFQTSGSSTPRLVEYFARVVAAMPAGTPPPIKPPVDPAEEDDMALPEGKKAEILNALAAIVHAYFPSIPQGQDPSLPGGGDPNGAWQGINEMWDRMNRPSKPRASLAALAYGAFVRLGAAGADAVKMDAMMDEIAAREAVLLR